MKSRAIVQTGPRALDMREFTVPEIDDESAILRIEACGICGSDAEQYNGVIQVQWPLIPGHEPLGIIEKIGDRAAQRWGVDAGDRVAGETLTPCGHCPTGSGGRYNLRRGRVDARFGYASGPRPRPAAVVGDHARDMYLDPHSLVHPIRKDIPANIAVMFNPLGAGFRWAVEMPQTGPGDTVLIMGPGQRGLASVIACRAAGAAGKTCYSGV